MMIRLEGHFLENVLCIKEVDFSVSIFIIGGALF